MLKKLKARISRMPTRLSKAGFWYVGAACLTSAAAYQSASNVLFLALAVMLSALLLNGLLSWWNFSKLEFQKIHCSTGYADAPCVIEFHFKDTKKAGKSLGLMAVIEVIPEIPDSKPQVIKQMVRARNLGGDDFTFSMDWTPTHRGEHHIRFKHIESYFPFGLLLKVFYLNLDTTTIIWPKQIRNQNRSVISHDTDESVQQSKTQQASIKTQNSTHNEPVITGIRSYQKGDPIRSFHWKKTAQKKRPLVVEQSSIASTTPNIVRFDFSASFFSGESEVHAYCSRIAEWAEREIRSGKPTQVALHSQLPIPLRKGVSLIQLLNALAVIQPQHATLNPNIPTIQTTLATPNNF